MKKIDTVREILVEFSRMIKKYFTPSEIRDYFDSNPRFGAFGHIMSEEEHNFLIEKGAIEHSLETEVEDALIYGEMRDYLL